LTFGLTDNSEQSEVNQDVLNNVGVLMTFEKGYFANGMHRKNYRV